MAAGVLSLNDRAWLVADELDTLIARLNLGRGDADLMHEIADLEGQLAELQTRDVRPSEVVRLLEEVSGPAILVAWVATDSARVRSRYAFEVLGLRMLIATVIADNERSMGMLAAAGYREVGRVPGRYWKRGAFRDQAILVLDSPGER